MIRWRRLSAGFRINALVTTLLSSGCILSTAPALADGGNGGEAPLHAGGAGGTGFNGASGGAGRLLSGGGGGAAGGGRGGDGSGIFGGSGGVGGTASSPNGADGGNAGFIGGGSGGGGGGGFNGNGSGASTLSNTGSMTGGHGGRGGNADLFDGAGGGGGGGGYGAIITGSTSSSNAGTITGGNGGRGGTGWSLFFLGGNGGDGGTGVQFTTPGATFLNTGTITGGHGGAGGSATVPAHAGSPGAGGIGIAGAGLTITNAGTISGGLSGDGATRANAIAFTGGTNALELWAGSSITGLVTAFSSADTLRLGGSSNATFDVSQIGSGAQFRGFGAFQKTGGSTWTLTGTTSQVTSWAINGGVLSISSDANLGAPSGSVTLNGGTLATTATLATSRSMILGGSGTFDTASGTTFTANGSIAGAGSLVKNGGGTMILAVGNSYSGGTTVNAGVLQLGPGGSLASTGALTVNGGLFDLNGNNQTVGALSGAGGTLNLGSGILTTNSASSTSLASAIIGSGGLVKSGTGTLLLTGNNSYSGGTTVAGGVLAGNTTSLQGNILNNATVVFDQSGTGTYAGNMSGTGSLVLQGTGGIILTGANSYSGGTTVSGGFLQGNTTSVQGHIQNNASVIFDQTTTGTYGGNMGGLGSLLKIGGGTLILSGSNSYSGGTTVAEGTLQGTTSSLQGNIVDNALVAFDQASTGTYAGSISGSGGLLISGGGMVILTGANSYSGGTTVSGSTLQGNTSSLQGAIVNNGAVVFDQATAGTFSGSMSGTGSVIVQGGGLIALPGNYTYTGGTIVNGSGLSVNGTLASGVTLNGNSVLRGAGTIAGLVVNASNVAPGNSIGTLSVTGNMVQNGGIYRVEVASAGQSDRISVGGTATINGGTVQVFSTPGSYATSTTYTILNATGGVTGRYTGLIENLAFLTPTLSYDANNVFLTLALQGNPFGGFEGNTPNQAAVGSALDRSYANASGDFATVIGALTGLETQQAPQALSALSGEPWADFGTTNLAAGTLFMNALAQQMALARGAASGGGQRQALAQACDIAACDGASPFSVWGSLLGGAGSVLGDGNASGLTYTLGGFAAGLDYRVNPSILVGLGAGYTSGTHWVNSFTGKGWTNTASVAAYGSFTHAGFYADLLAGYAWSNNQLQRQIAIPGLQPRTSSGSTSAGQFLGQVEIGYQVPVYAPASATLTPFARLQAMNVNQAGFSEWGANSISLNVQQQITNSLRSTLGAELAGAIPMGSGKTLDLALRLGWLHEYAYTGRPITTAFAGAPAAQFTVYGATPQRDAAAIGFSAATQVAEATQLYMRYDGDIGAGTDNHALNVGVRLSW
ncbi:MAG: autotransporter outer membrane beta-barrel domain-containing protein [Pseudomonadota bacterium]